MPSATTTREAPYLNRVIVNGNQLCVITGPERYYLAALKSAMSRMSKL